MCRNRISLAVVSCSLLAVASVFVAALSVVSEAASPVPSRVLEVAGAAGSRCAGRNVRAVDLEMLAESGGRTLAFRDDASGDLFWADSKSGAIRYWRPERPSAAPALQGDIGEAKAGRIAEDVSARMADETVPRSSRTGHLVEKTVSRRTDDVRDEYIVTLCEYIGEVRTQNQTRVVLSAADGTVLSAQSWDTPTRVVLAPSIAPALALAAAESAAHMPIHTGEFSEIRVLESAVTPQVLVWWVELATGNADFGGVRTVVIDAQSGAVLQVIEGGEHLRR
ncbi:MAG: hypothetical protein ACYC77_04080 [Coriobacteriia bacterium]